MMIRRLAAAVQKHLGLLCIACAGLFVLACVVQVHAQRLVDFQAKQPDPDGWQLEREEYWQGHIEKLGGERAYGEFAKEVSSEPVDEQHAQAHAFGKALYMTEGVPAVSVCDHQFSMGCFHEFLGQAIAGEGLAVVSTLAAQCDTLAELVHQSGCRHGIGHGVQAALGYKPGDLLKGLEVCRTVRTEAEDSIGGCNSGLFMEYNLRTMLGVGTSTLRQAKSGNLFAPCDAVPADAQDTCVFWLPQWWASLLFSDRPPGNYASEYGVMGERCHGLGLSRELLDYCFQGVGATLSSVSEEWPSATIEGCSIATASPRERLLCRAFAAGIAYEDVGNRAVSVCEGLSGAAYEYCAAFATGGADFINRPPVPEL